MGITPINSHHEAGPGQNQINFTVADPLNAADHACLFKTVVKSIAANNGLLLISVRSRSPTFREADITYQYPQRR